MNENERLVSDFFVIVAILMMDVKGFYVVELSGVFKVMVELISWLIHKNDRFMAN